MFRNLSLIEALVLTLVLVMLLTGIVMYYTDLPTFLWYTEEDHLVEWLTVLGLLLGFGVCMSRFFKLLKKRNWWFLLVTFMLGIMLFFAAGEEISWGQRIFNLKTPEYFNEHNLQHETNFHNLMLDGVKLNKLIFTVILGIGMAIYLIVVPIVHAKSNALRDFLDRSAVPVARVFHIIAFLVMAGLTTIVPHAKTAEMLECGAALIFFLMIRFPVNGYVFDQTRL